MLQPTMQQEVLILADAKATHQFHSPVLGHYVGLQTSGNTLLRLDRRHCQEGKANVADGQRAALQLPHANPQRSHTGAMWGVLAHSC